MTCKELNLLLLKNLPQLETNFNNFVSWQDGIDTGCHTTFENIFVPFIIETIEEENESVLKDIFFFINQLVISKDEYAEEVVQLSVLEPLKDEYDEVYDFSKLMLKETYSLYKTMTF